MNIVEKPGASVALEAGGAGGAISISPFSPGVPVVGFKGIMNFKLRSKEIKQRTQLKKVSFIQREIFLIGYLLLTRTLRKKITKQ